MNIRLKLKFIDVLKENFDLDELDFLDTDMTDEDWNEILNTARNELEEERPPKATKTAKK